MTDVDKLEEDYRSYRGWGPAGETTRISCELSRDFVRRLNHQARRMVVGRQLIIQSAIEGMVREFEAIDLEERGR